MAEPVVVVLAAGRATRFGGGKLDAMLAGKRVGQWVLDALEAAGLAPGVVVTGPDAPAFAANSGWPLVTNPDPHAGLGTSLAIAAHQTEGPLLVALADMPLVPTSHFAALLQYRFAATAWSGGKSGVPALFPAALLPKLRNLSGDQGAGPLLTATPDLALIEAPDDALLDIDRPEDLARAKTILQRG